MEKLNIIDYGISNLSMDEKRQFLYNLDYQIKYIHNNDGYVNNIDPSNIYIDSNNGFPFFEDIYSISKSGFTDSNEIKRINLLWLASLAISIYLPDYDLKNGLMSLEVLSNNFEQIKSFIPEEDIPYYRSIFSGTKTILYFSDYVQKLGVSNSNISSNAMKYIKSTPAGRAMAAIDSESGSINYVFITCVVFILIILVAFGIFYLTGIIF